MLEREIAKGKFYIRKEDLKKTSFDQHDMEAYIFNTRLDNDFLSDQFAEF